MKDNLPPHFLQFRRDAIVRRFQGILAFGVSVVGLVFVLFWVSAQDARAASCDNQYTVQSGDTVDGIASRHRTSARRIRSCNNLPSNVVRRGQTIQVPGQASSSSGNDSRYSRNGNSGGNTGTSTYTAQKNRESQESGNSSGSGSTSGSGQSGRNVATRRN